MVGSANLVVVICFDLKVYLIIINALKCGLLYLLNPPLPQISFLPLSVLF